MLLVRVYRVECALRKVVLKVRYNSCVNQTLTWLMIMMLMVFG